MGKVVKTDRDREREKEIKREVGGLWWEEGEKRRWKPEREGHREERSVGAAAVAATVDAIAANAIAMRGTTHERRSVCDGAQTY